jgi:uncharacterized protein (TIGR02246 family)
MRLLLLVILVSAASAMRAQSASDETTLRATVQKYFDARDAQQPGDVERLFTPDADQLVSSGEWRKGREAIVQGTLASSRNAQGKRTIAIESIRFLTPDVAIADGRYEIGGDQPRKMWSTFVFARTKDGWRISAIRNMLPAK